jgi:hypothetical protein
VSILRLKALVPPGDKGLVAVSVSFVWQAISPAVWAGGGGFRYLLRKLLDVVSTVAQIALVFEHTFIYGVFPDAILFPFFVDMQAPSDNRLRNRKAPRPHDGNQD